MHDIALQIAQAALPPPEPPGGVDPDNSADESSDDSDASSHEGPPPDEPPDELVPPDSPDAPDGPDELPPPDGPNPPQSPIVPVSPAGGAAAGHPSDLLQWDAPRLMGLGDFARGDPEGRSSGVTGENEGGEDKAVQQARALEQAEAELFDVAPPLIGVPPQRAEQGLLASGLQALVSSLPMARSLLDLVAPSGEWSEDGGVVSAGVGSTSSAGE